MSIRNWYGKSAIALAAVLLLGTTSANAALVYWQNFDGGNGVEDTAGTNGNLGMSGAATFSATGGNPDGALNNSTGAGYASTTAAGGSVLNLGTLSNFTVTMWVKVETFNSASSAGRMIIVGATDVTDALQANSFAMTVGTNTLAANRFFVTMGTSPLTGSTSGGVSTVNADEWTFVAVSYNAAGADAFYRGTMSESVDATALTMPAGGLAIGPTGVLHIGNRTSGSNRILDGWIDDVRIYDAPLDQAAIEAIRLESVPEPGAIVLATIGLIGLGICRMRRRP